MSVGHMCVHTAHVPAGSVRIAPGRMRGDALLWRLQFNAHMHWNAGDLYAPRLHASNAANVPAAGPEPRRPCAVWLYFDHLHGDGPPNHGQLRTCLRRELHLHKQCLHVRRDHHLCRAGQDLRSDRCGLRLNSELRLLHRTTGMCWRNVRLPALNSVPRSRAILR